MTDHRHVCDFHHTSFLTALHELKHFGGLAVMFKMLVVIMKNLLNFLCKCQTAHSAINFSLMFIR